MDLVIINPKDAKIKVVPMAHKPPMAVALENAKLRDYNEQERLMNSAKTVAYLLNLLGVNNKGQTDHHNLAVKFIAENMLDYSFQEIKLAFDFYVKGEYVENNQPMMITQQLNAVVIGKVMKAYQTKKNNELDQYRRARAQHLLDKMKPRELTPAEKDAITANGALRLFNEFKETGSVAKGHDYIYDYLKEKGFLKFSKSQFDAEHLQAKINVKRASKPMIKRGGKIVAPEFTESSVKSETKRLFLELYFKTIK